MKAEALVANCGQTAADSDMVKVPHSSDLTSLFASSENCLVRRII